MGGPQKLDGLFQGESESKMDDDWGYPYDLGNHHVRAVDFLRGQFLGGCLITITWVYGASPCSMA